MRLIASLNLGYSCRMILNSTHSFCSLLSADGGPKKMANKWPLHELHSCCSTVANPASARKKRTVNWKTMPGSYSTRPCWSKIPHVDSPGMPSWKKQSEAFRQAIKQAPSSNRIGPCRLPGRLLTLDVFVCSILIGSFDVQNHRKSVSRFKMYA